MRYSLGLGRSSLDHRRREEFPAIFTIIQNAGVNPRQPVLAAALGESRVMKKLLCNF